MIFDVWTFFTQTPMMPMCFERQSGCYAVAEWVFIMLQYSCSLDLKSLKEFTFKVSAIISHQSEIISTHLKKALQQDT